MDQTDDASGTQRVLDHLAHFGVIGMKWGERKARKAETSSDAQKSISVRDKAKTHSTKALTNDQLKTAIERMNLEQNFKRLAINEKGAAARFISSTLLDIGKQRITEIGQEKSKAFLRTKGVLKTAAKVATAVV